MGWQDDLQELLGEVTPDPIEPALRWGAGAGMDEKAKRRADSG